MHVTLSEVFSLAAGIILLVAGIILFFGVGKWGKRNYVIGSVRLTPEAIGFILFLAGILLMLGFFIPVLSPRFLSPGMS